MRYISILLLNLLLISSYSLLGMEAVTLSVWFDDKSDDKPLKDACSYFQYKMTITDLEKIQGVDLSDDTVVIRAKAPKVLEDAILIMGSLLPNVVIKGDKKQFARKCMALAVLYGAPVDTMAQGMTALWQAVKHKDEELITFLCEHDASPNLCTIPVFFLARTIKIAQLLHPKVDYTAVGLLKETVLHQAMQPEYPCELVEWYCKQGLSITATDKNGRNPLTTLVCGDVKDKAIQLQQWRQDKEKILLQAIEDEQERKPYRVAAYTAREELWKKVYKLDGKRIISYE